MFARSACDRIRHKVTFTHKRQTITDACHIYISPDDDTDEFEIDDKFRKFRRNNTDKANRQSNGYISKFRFSLFLFAKIFSLKNK